MFDVVTLGSATKDIFLFAKGSSLMPGEHSHMLTIPLDKKIEIGEVLEFTGGGATNAAATFANFHKKTAIISKVGNDHNANFIVKALRRIGVETRYIIHGKGETQFSDILVSGNGHMIILSHRGIGDTMSPRELDLSFSTKWMYISPLAGKSYNVLPRVISHCDRNGIRIALLPGSTELDVGFRGMHDVLARTDLLAMNVDEAGRFVGANGYMGNISSLAGAVRGTAIITLGEKGSIVASEGRIYRAGVFRTRQVNTVGAGDAYSSGFVTGMMDGRAVEDCINLASYNAKCVIGEYGAKAGLVDNYPRGSVGIRVIGSYKPLE